MLSFSISSLDLINFAYFTDTTEGGDRRGGSRGDRG